MRICTNIKKIKKRPSMIQNQMTVYTMRHIMLHYSYLQIKNIVNINTYINSVAHFLWLPLISSHTQSLFFVKI